MRENRNEPSSLNVKIRARQMHVHGRVRKIPSRETRGLKRLNNFLNKFLNFLNSKIFKGNSKEIVKYIMHS